MPAGRVAKDKSAAVTVKGLREFQQELRSIDVNAGRLLRKANLEAAKVVADEAKSKAEGLGSTAAHVANSIYEAAEQLYAKVVLDVAKSPEILGAEFGAKQYHQFQPWRGNQWEPDASNGVGYFLHPAIRETREEFMDRYEHLLDALSRQAFPTVFGLGAVGAVEHF